MSTNAPSQSKATGIIVGVSIAGVFFLLFMFALFHWYSRRMHPRRVVAGSDGSYDDDDEEWEHGDYDDDGRRGRGERREMMEV